MLPPLPLVGGEEDAGGGLVDGGGALVDGGGALEDGGGGGGVCLDFVGLAEDE